MAEAIWHSAQTGHEVVLREPAGGSARKT